MMGLAERRTYATQDHNADVTMKVNGWPMGSRFVADVGTGVHFDISMFDPDGDGVTVYELYRGTPGSETSTLIATAEDVTHEHLDAGLNPLFCWSLVQPKRLPGEH